MPNKRQNKIDITITIMSTLGILIAINFFSSNISTRFDLTQNKDYSLSSVSKKTAQELDDIVNIKLYFSSNLPPQYATLIQDVEDVIRDYANYSNGKIKYQIIDPIADKKIEEDVYFLGIPEIQFNVLEKDKYAVINGYLGIAIKYGDKTEVIPVVETTANLEYDLTLAIKKATSTKMPQIGIFGNNDNMQISTEKVKEIYNIEQVDLNNNAESLDHIDTLIIAGVNHELSEDSLRAIDKHVTSGKSALFLLDGVTINEGLVAARNDTNLFGLLSEYGVNISNNLVLDRSSGFTSFSQGFMSFTLNYPFWPKIIQKGFNKDNVAVSKLESLVLPWVSSIELSRKGDAQIQYLLKTTKNAWSQSEQFDLSPRSPGLNYPTEPTGEHVLAYSISGNLKSVYDESLTENARLVVVADSDFISDRYLRQNPENLLFFQNIVDYVSIDEDLINIRSKGVTDRPIKEIGDKTRLIIRYFNIFGITFAVICYGMLRYYIRRRKQY